MERQNKEMLWYETIGSGQLFLFLLIHVSSFFDLPWPFLPAGPLEPLLGKSNHFIKRRDAKTDGAATMIVKKKVAKEFFYLLFVKILITIQYL